MYLKKGTHIYSLYCQLQLYPLRNSNYKCNVLLSSQLISKEETDHYVLMKELSQFV